MGRGINAAQSRVSMRMLVPFGLACRTRGLEPTALLADAGIPPGAFLDFESGTTHAKFARLFELAEERSKDPAFGLHASEHIDFGMFHALEQETPWLAAQAFATAATVGEGMERFARAIRTVHPAARYDLVEEDGGAFALRYSLEDGSDAPRGMVELAFGIVAGMLRSFPDVPVDPIAVRFAHARGGSLDSYLRVLRAAPEFDRVHDELVVSADDWRKPLRTARPALAARLEARIPALRAVDGRPDATTTLRERARDILAGELTNGSPTAERLAERIGISVRTLHRRLREQDTSHRQLLEELRKERAWKLLVDQGLTVREATMQLGFSEPAVLKRAVKRWFGRSPAALRADSE